MNKRLLHSNTIREFALGDTAKEDLGDNHENNDAKMNNDNTDSPYQTVTANTPIDKTMYYQLERRMYFIYCFF